MQQKLLETTSYHADGKLDIDIDVGTLITKHGVRYPKLRHLMPH